MNKRVILGACLVGAISLFVYAIALLLGVNYTELIGITIIQIVYIVGLGVYGTVLMYKKIKEETAAEKVPVRVEHQDDKDRYEDFSN